MREMIAVNYPPLPCRASPPQGGRSTRGIRIARTATSTTGDTLLHPISPPQGEMPGRAEGGKAKPRREEVRHVF